jgi:hypothetical protein
MVSLRILSFWRAQNLFQKKDNQKERIERVFWALAIMVSVSCSLVTLILFIAAISLSGCFTCHRQNCIKRFFRIKPKSTPIVSMKKPKKALTKIMADHSAELALQETRRSDFG